MSFTLPLNAHVCCDQIVRFHRGTKQVEFPFENGMIPLALFYFLLFSEAVITVFDFCTPEVSLSCVLTNVSGHHLVSLLPLCLYSFNKCLLRSYDVLGTFLDTEDTAVSKKHKYPTVVELIFQCRRQTINKRNK